MVLLAARHRNQVLDLGAGRGCGFFHPDVRAGFDAVPGKTGSADVAIFGVVGDDEDDVRFLGRQHGLVVGVGPLGAEHLCEPLGAFGREVADRHEVDWRIAEGRVDVAIGVTARADEAGLEPLLVLEVVADLPLDVMRHD